MDVDEKARVLALQIKDWPDAPTHQEKRDRIAQALREAQEDGAKRMKAQAVRAFHTPDPERPIGIGRAYSWMKQLDPRDVLDHDSQDGEA